MKIITNLLEKEWKKQLREMGHKLTIAELTYPDLLPNKRILCRPDCYPNKS